MSKRNIEAVYPLSPMQQGMLFHSLYAPDSGVYFEQVCCTLRGDLSVPAFERAWERAIERHSVLRTSFVWKRLDKTLQVVHKQVELPLEQQDWRGLSEDEQQARLEAFLQAERSRGFNLGRPPLLRLTLMRIADDAYYFVLCHHHTLLDGWSMPMLFKEVLSFYEAFSRGQELELPAPRPYRDYIAWLQKQDLAEAEAFWRQALQNFAAPTPLTVDRDPGPASRETEDYDTLETRLSRETTIAIESLTRQHRLTLNTLIQGVWAILLSRYSGETDVVFGATVSGRPPDLVGAEKMMGLFINTLPVRVQVPSDAAVVSWLQGLMAQQAELRQYEYSPLVQVQEWSDVPRGTPLFESILVFENFPVDTLQGATPTGSLKIEDVRAIEQTNYPLTLASAPSEALMLRIAYEGRRFDAGAIRRMLGHLKTLLEAIAADPQQPVSALPLLTEAERRQMLVAWNDTAADYPREKCAHELFEAQVERTPDAIAVTFAASQPTNKQTYKQTTHLTYRQLNQRANQLAHHLQKLGVGPETMVGICTERSPEMIVGLLGVLKAGGAYVPLDPDYPAERLTFMLEDTRVPVLLTQAHLVERLPTNQPTLIRLDADWDACAIARESDENPESGATAESLAYVIYTSGSTGRPKGTLLYHRGLCNFIIDQSRVLGMGEKSSILQFSSFGFDASVSEIFSALLSGATLHLAPRETLLSIPDLTQLLQEQGITTAILPPSVLKILAPEQVPALKAVMSAGEACSPDIVERWAPGRRFFNGYGPTETSVGATWNLLEEMPEGETNVPIGRPFANVQIYLLDTNLQPVPVGVPGELCIGGDGVGRGYLNRPELTAQKFIPDPFVRGERREERGERLYRTGDLARYRPDGVLEFLGRIDHQVKIRGFRIELGEIEALLSQHPAVQTATALAWEGERLVAYVVPQADGAISSRELRDYLKEKLPDYMVPSAFVTLDEMPLTPSGKVDRRALPAPDGVRPELEEAYVAPRTPEEEILAGIWAQVLGVERVGVRDNFHELGGHSLLATQLASRIREAFQVDLPLRELFEKPTVAGLVEVIRAAGREEGELVPPIEPVSRDAVTGLPTASPPLSFAQQRLWFLDQLEPGNLFYNIPTGVRLSGALDVAALRRGLNEVVRRHEALRTTFATVDGKPVQVIGPELTLDLPVEDLRDLPKDEREAEALRRATAEARRPFDLSQGPLLRASLLRLGDEDYIAVFTAHHIVADGWSMAVFVREVATLYAVFAAGKASPLPELRVQYADYAHWQRGWLQGEVLEAQLDYWKEQLAGSPPMLELPTDRPRPAVQSARGAHLPFMLSTELSEAVRDLSQAQGVTLFMTLLAAFQTLLYRYTGQDDVSVGTPIANRTRGEIEDLIGFFANTLVMRGDLSGDPSFEELLKRVRETALGAYAHQDLPFEMLVEELQPQRDLSHTPLFQVMFVLNTASGETLELPELTLQPVTLEKGTATFDLTVQMTEGHDKLGGYIEYNTDLFDQETIERMVKHLQVLLNTVVADPKQSVSQLPILSPAERDQLLVEWNDTAVPFPDETCIHHLFERQAAERPDALAALFVPQQGAVARLTYDELNGRANQLAHYLQKRGVGPETLVGISTLRSLEMVVGILGVLKAGGAYLPLDPTYPQERLAFMLQDSAITVLLTQEQLVERLPIQPTNQQTNQLSSRARRGTTVVCLDADWDEIAREPEENPESGSAAESLAYVIYTSGSTGVPKGTMLRHRGLCNLTDVQRRAFNIREESRVLQFSPFSFDASVWETFMALRNGAALVLAPQETLASGQALVTLLAEQGVTNVTLPPSVLAVLPEAELPSLETVIAAGEACTADLMGRWAPGRAFFNAYGPTETTVCASMYRCDPGEKRNPPIGRPIDNTRLYVVDRNLQPVPVGVPGELLVGGVSLARGYLNRPDLTAEKFVRDPFVRGERREGRGEGRLYRTGDLVRYRRDGNIEFLGRIDHQVKVRGFRVELGEIEAVLGEHPDLQDSAVIVREDVPGDKRLVAYVVLDPELPDPGLPSSELRGYLRQTLPEYMVPSAFVTLEALPLSPSGKVDRGALPAPDRSDLELAQAYVAPRNEMEEQLATICGELLGVERVGVHDSFFDLGGHSLLATQFISRVRDTFHVELPLRTLFEHPTVAGLAEEIEKAEAQSVAPPAPAITRVSREGRRVKRSALTQDDK